MAARISSNSFASERWKASAAPCILMTALRGRPSSWAACMMSSTASPSDAPGARLKEIEVAGKSARRAMGGGAVFFRPRGTTHRGDLPGPGGGGTQKDVNENRESGGE